MKEGYQSKLVYNISGEFGLIDQVKKMVLEGVDVCPHSSHSVGMGAYCIVWKEPEPEVVIPEVPDWEEVESFKFRPESKQKLLDYAKKFVEIVDEDFDKRKGFDKLLGQFKELYEQSLLEDG